MNRNHQDQIKLLHAEYERHTGMKIALTIPRIYVWEAWLLNGWDSDDLSQVIEFRLHKIKANGLTMSGLHFMNLLRMIENFEEDLAEVRARARAKHAPADKARVLLATGRSAAPRPSQARTPAQIMAGDAALREFLKVRESL